MEKEFNLNCPHDATEIFSMQKEDIPFVAKLEKECFGKNAWSENSLSYELTNSNAYFFVLKTNETVCGYIGTNIILDECYISNVAVSTSCRRQGTGTKLIEFAKKNAQSLGCAFITLECRKSNLAAVSLYKKCGFEICAQRKNFYSNPKEDAYILTHYYNKEERK